MLMCEVFRYFMVFSDFMACVAHGSNDVANAIAPLIIIMELEGYENKYAFLLGAFGIAFGLLVLGHIVIKVVGKDIVSLDFQKGFTAQIATATTVTIGSSLSYPLSTTHCMIGSLGGIYLASKSSQMKQLYWGKKLNKNKVDEEHNKEEETEVVSGEAAKLNMATVKKILFWWAITIPCAMTFSILICWITLQIN